MSNTFPFEILGHFEEIIEIASMKCIGTRFVTYEKPPAYGYAGRRSHTFKKGEVILLDKSHKGEQPYKFKNTITCWIMTHPICGRMMK